jgi:hypothetical protein
MAAMPVSLDRNLAGVMISIYTRARVPLGEISKLSAEPLFNASQDDVQVK